jgi:hypothetical protein
LGVAATAGDFAALFGSVWEEMFPCEHGCGLAAGSQEGQIAAQIENA